MKPTIGTQVKVVLDYSDYYKLHPSYVSRIETVDGTVIPSLKSDSPNSFRIQTKTRIALIELDKTVKSIMVNNENFKVETPKYQENKRTFDVKSKGNIYHVVVIGDKFECDCTGFGFRKACKHSNAVKDFIIKGK